MVVLNAMTSRTVFLLFGGLLLLTALSGVPGAAPPQTSSPRVIEITAERFEFWPSQIDLVEGEDVELRIRSDDTMHGFRIAGTQTNAVVPKRGRGQAVVRFSAVRAGRYAFECTRMCGAG